jgi:protein-L-isoaspartate(D-aspartate) O-methyltransferase
VDGRALDDGCGAREVSAYLSPLGYIVDGADFAEGTARTDRRAECWDARSARWLCLDVEYDGLAVLITSVVDARGS